jgi:hypothetical protein
VTTDWTGAASNQESLTSRSHRKVIGPHEISLFIGADPFGDVRRRDFDDAAIFKFKNGNRPQIPAVLFTQLAFPA